MDYLILAVKLVLWCVCFGKRDCYLSLRARVARITAGLGIYERRNILLLRKLVKTGDTVVDAGAGFGAYTSALAKLVGANGKVLAFEPLPFTHAWLQSSESGRRQVRCYRMGLGNQHGPSVFKLPLLFGAVPEPALVTLECTHLKFEEISAEVRPLDSFISELGGLTFIKADLEGHEQAFLAGARETVKRFRPAIQLEENDPAGLVKYQEFCKQNNYELRGLNQKGELAAVNDISNASGRNFYLLPR